MNVQGIIVSQKANKVLSFIEKTGASPFNAIVVGTGLSCGDVNRGCNILRAAGYSVPLRLNETEFWALIENNQGGSADFNPQNQAALAWFVARLIQEGGDYADGIAKYPKGVKLPVTVTGTSVKSGNLVARLEDLQTKALKECLYRAN